MMSQHKGVNAFRWRKELFFPDGGNVVTKASKRSIRPCFFVAENKLVNDWTSIRFVFEISFE